jgi:hypothetical protein
MKVRINICNYKIIQYQINKQMLFNIINRLKIVGIKCLTLKIRLISVIIFNLTIKFKKIKYILTI